MTKREQWEAIKQADPAMAEFVRLVKEKFGKVTLEKLVLKQGAGEQT